MQTNRLFGDLLPYSPQFIAYYAICYSVIAFFFNDFNKLESNHQNRQTIAYDDDDDHKGESFLMYRPHFILIDEGHFLQFKRTIKMKAGNRFGCLNQKFCRLK